MKKLLFVLSTAVILVCLLAISVSAAPTKPQLDVAFGEVTAIEGFVPPSQLYAGTTERVLLTDGNGGYVTYPTYYVTKDNATFDMDFSKLNEAQSVEYSKKSVVMLEIPNGVTAVSQSYFAGTSNFPLCVSVQVPGSVTTYGAYMFQTNTVIRVVEFLDGTEPVTMGDGMFGSNWSVGTTVLEYVKLPNNLVSIGNGTFGKSHASKTIILGANLQSIGTGFFGESTPNSKDTFLYVPDTFFADNSTVFTNLFGTHAPYHRNQLRLTIFYAGSKEKAQALVDACAALQTGYVFNNATLVSASEYVYETHKPTKDLSATIVYDYDKCDAFYGGHQMSGQEQIIVDSYFSAISIGDKCKNCDLKTVTATMDAIFVNYGYSCTEEKINGSYAVSQFFGINKKALDDYVLATGNTFEYGLVVSTVNNPLAEENSGLVAEGKTYITTQSKFAHNYFAINVKGINDGTEGTKDTRDNALTFCAYVIDNGKVYYLDGGKTLEAAEQKSYNDVLSVKQ